MSRCDDLTFSGILFAAAFSVLVTIHCLTPAGPSYSLAVIFFGMATGLFGSNLWDYFRRRQKG